MAIPLDPKQIVSFEELLMSKKNFSQYLKGDEKRTYF
jgi:hypothetical protein